MIIPLHDEEQLWKEFRMGSNEALTTIYSQYVGKLYTYGRQFTSNGELVRDCIQDLFCELIQNRKNLGSTTSIKFYLLACVRNKLTRAIKKNGKHSHLDDIEEGNGFGVEFLVQNEAFVEYFNLETKHTIENAFNKLPIKQREAVILYFYENLSYQEITDIMQIGKVKSTRALIYRSLESLSSLLYNFKLHSELA
ncbi:RNA polymerase sigma factor [Xanthocytophaga flava]|uniref:RNA polymerase sigma factor n=1 Tax=Xanthocytophaga flava TaxID=3048013 RepID=UPI0028D86A5D|nr:RNA polymerase sigma factor [Xanthocytophaga flavus]MDJ1469401.1 RNA polymerase sigma factor [Xanthocytophaga flavus]